MVVKDKMFKLIILNDLNCNAFSQYLEKMAQDGWIFYGSIGPLFKFKKEEPKELNFNIDLFYDADSSTKKMIKSYMDICDASGWKFISKCGYYYIFCSEDNNTDFETDFETTLLKHRNAMALMGLFLFVSLVSLILSILNVKMNYDLYNDYLNLFIENQEILGPVSNLDISWAPNILDDILYIFSEITGTVILSTYFISSFIWYRKHKDNVYSYNEEVTYISYDTAMTNNKLYKFVGVNIITLTIIYALVLKNNLMYLKLICILLMIIIILTLIYTLIKVTREIQCS